MTNWAAGWMRNRPDLWVMISALLRGSLAAFVLNKNARNHAVFSAENDTGFQPKACGNALAWAGANEAFDA
ncbi:hypothetical protein QN363_09030, partial [Undibacterium sp. CCC2.1]|uniref:hypothetical protein n=1 Tax=unclassified Undibacterium TaxID=2630295 RepID=UPI002B223923